MATSKKEELAKVEAATTAVAALDDMIAAARPEGKDDSDLGTENIRPEDVLIPRIGIVQKTSKELEEGHPRYIEGVRFLDLYNSVTRGSYGRGPVHFVVLRVDRPRGVQFRPLDEGGGIIDPNVPLDDPRMAFGAVDPATGKATKPLATKFYDFLILVLTGLDLSDPGANLAAFSFKSTGIKAAKQLNMLIMQRGPKALYKGVYEVSTAQDSNASGAFGVFKIKNAGWLKPDSPAERLAAEMFQAWKHVETKIDRDDTPEDPDTFDPARYEAEQQARSGSGTAADPGM